MEEVNFEGNLSSEEIKEIRKLIVDTASNIDSSSGKRLKLSDIDCSKELLDKIIFDHFKTQSGDTYKKIFDELNKLMPKIDFDGVSFDGVNISITDFTGSKGAKINPQTICLKNLSCNVCSGVKFIGPFDEVNLFCTNFTGSKGAKINPQTILEKKLIGTTLAGVKFIGPFDGVNLYCADFTGSKGAKINPQTIYDKSLCRAVCADAKFTGSFDDVKMNDETSLDGSNVRYIDSCKRVKESIKKLIK